MNTASPIRTAEWRIADRAVATRSIRILAGHAQGLPGGGCPVVDLPRVRARPYPPPSHVPTIADIAVSGARAGSDGLLSYAVPPALRGSLENGQVVWVPLRGKPALGVVARLHDEAPPFALKPIARHRRPAAPSLAEAARNRALVGAADRQQSLRRARALLAARRRAPGPAISAAHRARFRSQSSSPRPRIGC